MGVIGLIGRDRMTAAGIRHGRHKIMGAGANGKEPLCWIAAETIELVGSFVEKLGAGLHPVVHADLCPEIAGLGRAKDLAERAILPILGGAATLDACREEGV